MILKLKLIVTNPLTHRRKEKEERLKFYEDIGGIPENVIDTLLDTDIPDDLWLCDVCNVKVHTLPTENTDVGEIRLELPVFVYTTTSRDIYEVLRVQSMELKTVTGYGGDVLCTDCTKKYYSSYNKELKCGCCEYSDFEDRR